MLNRLLEKLGQQDKDDWMILGTVAFVACLTFADYAGYVNLERFNKSLTHVSPIITLVVGLRFKQVK